MTNNPTPKYQIGQEVWFIDNNIVYKNEVAGIYRSAIWSYYYTFYSIKFTIPSSEYWHKEKLLFPTKQSLIDSL